MKEFVEDEIYPLTITADRYTGAYSGGAFIAWNLEPWLVPEGTEYDGADGLDFWEENKIVYGKGRTVSEALVDLYCKLKTKEMEV